MALAGEIGDSFAAEALGVDDGGGAFVPLLAVGAGKTLVDGALLSCPQTPVGHHSSACVTTLAGGGAR